MWLTWRCPPGSEAKVEDGQRAGNRLQFCIHQQSSLHRTRFLASKRWNNEMDLRAGRTITHQLGRIMALDGESPGTDSSTVYLSDLIPFEVSTLTRSRPREGVQNRQYGAKITQKCVLFGLDSDQVGTGYGPERMCAFPSCFRSSKKAHARDCSCGLNLKL